MVMTIRPVVPGDLPALRELFLQSRLATFTWELSSSLALGDFDSQTTGEWQLVALDGGRPVGFISVWEPTHFIHHLHVHPQFARRGIGQALLRALPGWSTTRYQLKCVRLNATAIAFYHANQFAQVGAGNDGAQDYLLLEAPCPADASLP